MIGASVNAVMRASVGSIQRSAVPRATSAAKLMPTVIRTTTDTTSQSPWAKVDHAHMPTTTSRARPNGMSNSLIRAFRLPRKGVVELFGAMAGRVGRVVIGLLGGRHRVAQLRREVA